MSNRLLAIALIVLVGMGTVSLFAWSERRIGAAQEGERVALVRFDSLSRELRRIDTVYTRDTLRLWRVKTEFDSTIVTVTEWKHDTLKVVEFVQLADSTVKSCVAALLTCEQRVGIERKRTVAATDAYDLHLRSHPSKFRTVILDVGMVLAGVGLGQLIPH